MTQNISYDCKAYDTYVPNLVVDDDFEEKAIRKTLATKKGICNDYALVFKELCSREDIPCRKISGFVPTGRPFVMLRFQYDDNSNHAWNVVRIKNKWYLIDVTWASGYANGSMTKFTKQLNDKYYLTEPEVFILDHHPSNPMWQLLDNPVSMKEFIDKARKKK